MFSIAVPSHSSVAVYYLLWKDEISLVWDFFCAPGTESDTLTEFGKMWTTLGVGCVKHASP